MKTAKKRTRRLTQEDWAFQKIPNNELRFAWIWEIERELGSGAPPWLAVKPNFRRWLAKPNRYSSSKDNQRLTRIPLDAAQRSLDLTKAAWLKCGDGRTAHLIRIDWTESDTSLTDAFKSMVAEMRKSVPEARLHKPLKSKARRPKDYMSRLVDLAIYRVSNSGLTCEAGCTLLWPLLQAAEMKSRQDAKHWSTAKQRTSEELRRREFD